MLMPFKEIIAVYNEKHIKPINTEHSHIYVVKMAGAHNYY
jgi:hypothetical protein